jgi:hypothetical protein
MVFHRYTVHRTNRKCFLKSLEPVDLCNGDALYFFEVATELLNNI